MADLLGLGVVEEIDEIVPVSRARSSATKAATGIGAMVNESAAAIAVALTAVGDVANASAEIVKGSLALAGAVTTGAIETVTGAVSSEVKGKADEAGEEAGAVIGAVADLSAGSIDKTTDFIVTKSSKAVILSSTFASGVANRVGKLAVASRNLTTSTVEAAKTRVGLGSKSPVPLVTGTKCVPLYVCLSLFM